MPSSPSRKSRSLEERTTTNKMDSKMRLELFSIFYERAPIPTILKKHISNLQKQREAPSPNVKKIQEIVPFAHLMFEQDGIDALEELLLLAPARKGGMPCIERTANLNLNAHFLPRATSSVDESLRLERAQPDHCFWYLPSRKAMRAMEAPFTTMEESILNKYVTSTPCPPQHLQLRLNLIDTNHHC